jgi:hypothetical protein
MAAQHDADARDHGSATQLAVLTAIAEFDFACLTRLTMSAFLIASEPVMHLLQSLPVPLQKPWALSGCC